MSQEQSSQVRKGSSNTRENNTEQSLAHQGTGSPQSLARIQNNASQPTLNKINLSIRDFKDQDINQVLTDEQYFYAASRVFQNNNAQLLKEIDTKRKIVVSKVVYSKGMYHKFVLTARCN